MKKTRSVSDSKKLKILNNGKVIWKEKIIKKICQNPIRIGLSKKLVYTSDKIRRLFWIWKKFEKSNFPEFCPIRNGFFRKIEKLDPYRTGENFIKFYIRKQKMEPSTVLQKKWKKLQNCAKFQYFFTRDFLCILQLSF